ncbi:hypothetical protein H4R35_005540, partial [Dimargaris xerosporica]
MSLADTLYYYLMGLKQPIYHNAKAAQLAVLVEAQSHALEMDGVFANAQSAP